MASPSCEHTNILGWVNTRQVWKLCINEVVKENAGTGAYEIGCFHEIKFQGQQDGLASKDICHQAEDLSSILGTHQVEGENQLPYVVL